MKKLVRDNIVNIINKSGKTVEYYVAGNEEYEKRLFDKMSEELLEFIENPCIEEAADMYEVWLAILSHWNMVPLDVASLGNKKRKEKGGFTSKIIIDLNTIKEKDGS